jgi:hypothetical protein
LTAYRPGGPDGALSACRDHGPRDRTMVINRPLRRPATVPTSELTAHTTREAMTGLYQAQGPVTVSIPLLPARFSHVGVSAW